MKFEMHCHTSENDLFSYVSGKEMVRRYKESGYGGIVITNHYFKMFYEWFGKDLSGKSKTEIIKRWLLGYYEAKEEGERIGMVVLPGAEVRFDGSNINDYLIYGVDEEFFYKAPLLNEFSRIEELRECLPENSLIVHAHPFRNNMTVTEPKLLDGIEVYNSGTEDYRNSMALNFANYYSKLKFSGSDCHDVDHIAKGGINFKCKINTPGELVNALKKREYELIENGNQD